ncbi:MAG TPA: C-terminal helicase domain-containing protein, partial [Kofleriaceae bacterium]|nr:C-terminal helicase domain-containing protein [Kofleriaceae bacterium]
GRSDVFLISLKAGGAGLNLTGADTVIHYDPWWNPAAQAQATDRAHRIGQTKPVFVHDLIVAGSVEERMLGLQRHKRALANAILADRDPTGTSLTDRDVDDLLAPLA